MRATEELIGKVEADQIVETKTAPRVTESYIKGRIEDVSYVYHGTMTICFITMVNGFKAVGTSACASPDNFDIRVGQRYAFDNAFKQLWALEAYVMLERLNGAR